MAVPVGVPVRANGVGHPSRGGRVGAPGRRSRHAVPLGAGGARVWTSDTRSLRTKGRRWAAVTRTRIARLLSSASSVRECWQTSSWLTVQVWASEHLPTLAERKVGVSSLLTAGPCPARVLCAPRAGPACGLREVGGGEASARGRELIALGGRRAVLVCAQRAADCRGAVAVRDDASSQAACPALSRPLCRRAGWLSPCIYLPISVTPCSLNICACTLPSHTFDAAG